MISANKQEPRRQSFPVPPISGKLAVVTGSNSGIGFETALALADAQAEVVLAVRDLGRGADAAERILAASPQARIRVESLDLADLASVHGFAGRLRALGRSVDILVNNAGVMKPPRRIVTADGLELQFATNFLGHFALTVGLLPLLSASPTPRVVSLSSLYHRVGRIRFDDLQEARSYRPGRAYAQSKLATLMFAGELQRRSNAAGWHLMSNAAHPGSAHTGLQSAGANLGTDRKGDDLLTRLTGRIPGIWQDAAAGSRPVLYAATSPHATGGGYYGPGGLFETAGDPAPAAWSRRARDRAAAARLWEVSADLAGVSATSA